MEQPTKVGGSSDYEIANTLARCAFRQSKQSELIVENSDLRSTLSRLEDEMKELTNDAHVPNNLQQTSHKRKNLPPVQGNRMHGVPYGASPTPPALKPHMQVCWTNQMHWEMWSACFFNSAKLVPSYGSTNVCYVGSGCWLIIWASYFVVNADLVAQNLDEELKDKLGDLRRRMVCSSALYNYSFHCKVKYFSLDANHSSRAEGGWRISGHVTFGQFSSWRFWITVASQMSHYVRVSFQAYRYIYESLRGLGLNQGPGDFSGI